MAHLFLSCVVLSSIYYHMYNLQNCHRQKTNMSTVLTCILYGNTGPQKRINQIQDDDQESEQIPQEYTASQPAIDKELDYSRSANNNDNDDDDSYIDPADDELHDEDDHNAQDQEDVKNNEDHDANLEQDA